VHPGQPIDICLNGVDDTKAPTPPASQAPAAPAASPQCTYTVVAGDSEFSIAKKTGVTGKDLATENGYTVGQAKLFPGMLLDTCINGQPDAARATATIITTTPTTALRCAGWRAIATRTKA
jgi:LysM repeat protein